MASPAPDLPLAGVRVVDLAEGHFQGVGRQLADLGAEVLRIEPPGGSADRQGGVRSAGTSLTFAVLNANKSGASADVSTDQGRAELAALVVDAAVVLVSAESDFFRTGLFDREEAARRFPSTVVVVLSDFGLTGPKSGWRATPAVLFAQSTLLASSGMPDVVEPLLPPSFLAYGSATVQAVWATLVAYVHARRNGRGDYVDFSALEGLIQTIDPPVGMTGTARAGQSMADLPRGRPSAGHLYPIFPAADGHVRICLLAPRQWQGMFRWLGEPEEFADPEYAVIRTRYAAADRLYPVIGELLAGLTCDQAVEQGGAHGVPIAEVAPVEHVLAEPAFRAAGDFSELALADGRIATVPLGVYEIDGVRAGVRSPAPDLPLDAPASPRPEAASGARTATSPSPAHPFSGLRVLDLGVIVVGAELGRLFGDHGADVVKVESRSAPDGARTTRPGVLMNNMVAWGQRNKRSLGLNLKSEGGRAIFARLV